MPLRDHFHPPLPNTPNAESINANWATMLLRRLNATVLPDGYRAEQEVFGGPRVTIDLGTLERPPVNGHPANGGGGAAVATRRYAQVGRVAAVSYRVASAGETGRLEVWPEDLVVGSPLPTVPLWLAADLAVPVDLETTYEAAWACHRR